MKFYILWNIGKIFFFILKESFFVVDDAGYIQVDYIKWDFYLAAFLMEDPYKILFNCTKAEIKKYKQPSFNIKQCRKQI